MSALRDLAQILLLFGTMMEYAGGQSCLFPEFVQSRFRGQQERQWYGHITKHGRDSPKSFSYIITFNDATMKAAVIAGRKVRQRPSPYTRECLQQVQPGKYLVAHRETGLTRERYTCVQFLLRSLNVLQVKEAPLDEWPNTKLCEDSVMNVNPWPFITKAGLFENYIECPLTGGYNMKIYDKMTKQGVCDAFNGETRLESECMDGEGLYFRFRHANCVPDGLRMHKDQRVYCIAKWEEGDNTFAILQHDKADHRWCLRYRTNPGKAFIAYLFHDVYCNMEAFPKATNEYLQLELKRDMPRPLSHLCMDDYEACDMWSNPCRHAGSLPALSCPRTCGLCGDSRPATCTLPGKIHGKWVDTSDSEKDIISVSDMFVNVEGFSEMQCIKWNDFSNEDPNFSEHMLVSTFENGCRPRYQCAQFQKKTPSILRFKLSQSQIWPFEDTIGSWIDCRSFRFRDDDRPLEDRFRSKHFKTLISMTDRIYINCKLIKSRDFVVTFKNGDKCNGTLTQEELSSRNKMKMHLDSCLGQAPDQEFACLDSATHGYYGDQMIVTESLDLSSKLRCWLFPASPGDTFYLMPASQCNEGTLDKITAGQVRPLATFRDKRSLIVEFEAVVQMQEAKKARERQGKVSGSDPSSSDKDSGGETILLQDDTQQKGAASGVDTSGAKSALQILFTIKPSLVNGLNIWLPLILTFTSLIHQASC